jgi:hypothetical protein
MNEKSRKIVIVEQIDIIFFINTKAVQNIELSNIYSEYI